MKESSITDFHMDKAMLSIQRVMFMKGILNMVSLTAEELFSIPMEINMPSKDQKQDVTNGSAAIQAGGNITIKKGLLLLPNAVCSTKINHTWQLIGRS